MNLRDFLRSHPAVIECAKALEHAGLDAAEDLAIGIIGAKLGFFSHLLPVQTIADSIKSGAEIFIDTKLDALEAPAPAPAAQPPAAPAAAPATEGAPPQATVYPPGMDAYAKAKRDAAAARIEAASTFNGGKRAWDSAQDGQG